MLILDFKTLPDAAAGKRLLALERFGDAETLLAMRTLRVAAQGDAAMPPHLCRVAVVSLVQLDEQALRVRRFDALADEADALRALEAAVAETGETPWLWQGTPALRTLLLARALAHGLALPALLAQGGPRCISTEHGLGRVPLHEIAAVHGLPHRLGFQSDETEALDGLARERLCAGSEADGLMTALLHLALGRASGVIGADEAAACRRCVAGWLATQTAPHWRQFQQHWAA